jgi:peptide/nickel transport system substrate-binding protein
MMEAVGFKVDLQVMDWATLVKRRSDPKEYEIHGTAHVANDHPSLQPYLSPSWPGFWENEQRDKLLGDLFAATDPAKIKQILTDMQALFWQEVPGIKICEYFQLQARSNKLMGYVAGTDWFWWNTWLG